MSIERLVAILTFIVVVLAGLGAFAYYVPEARSALIPVITGTAGTVIGWLCKSPIPE